jgi:hypothetical protein
MAKLYLIRRNLESFVGPMPAGEVQASYKRMAFGLQDEVSGHAGPWVSFDDIEKLRRHYPEISRIIHDEMFSGWNVQDQTAQKVVTRENKKQKPSRPPRRNLGLAVACLIIAVFAFAAAVFLATGHRYSAKMAAKDGVPQAIAEFSDDLDAIDKFIDSNKKELVAADSRAELELWLPYLRLYAFRRDGTIEQLPGKVLRGTLSNSAPTDCSLSAWKKRWRQSAKQWEAFAAGKNVGKSAWNRVLLWDPHWIRSRPVAGWIEPQNYFAACLQMGLAALDSLSSEPGAEEISRDAWQKLRTRVSLLRDLSRGLVVGEEPNAATDVYAALNCQDRAPDVASLDNCQRLYSGLDSFAKTLENRRLGIELRLMTRALGAHNEQMAERANALIDQQAVIAETIGLDYRSEARVLKAGIRLGLDFPQAVNRIRVEDPNFDLVP